LNPVLQPDPGVDLQTAVAALLKVAENIEIVRRIESPASGPLSLPVSGDADSAAVHVFRRQKVSYGRSFGARGLRWVASPGMRHEAAV
jgi:hypothetical protein